VAQIKTDASALAPGSNANQTLAPSDDTPPVITPSLAKEIRRPLLAAGPETLTFKSSDLVEGEPSLTELFPDLTAYAPPTANDGKADKRVDESSQHAGRLLHASRLMDIRPVLVSTLQPSKNRHPSGRWEAIDDGSIYDDIADYDEWMQAPPSSSQTVAREYRQMPSVAQQR
jgi:hypothetical protein